MEFAVFSKRRQTKEGKPYNIYITRLHKKDGSVVPVRLKFREDCGNPKPEMCPLNIIVSKENANMIVSEYVREDTGEVGTSYTMWVSAWSVGSEYVDTSLDDFDV